MVSKAVRGNEYKKVVFGNLNMENVVHRKLYIESCARKAVHGKLCMEIFKVKALHGKLCKESCAWKAVHRMLCKKAVHGKL